MAVKIRGGRSLEGLMAYPVLIPIDMPITKTRSPVTTAWVPFKAGLFFSSWMISMPKSSTAVPVN